MKQPSPPLGFQVFQLDPALVPGLLAALARHLPRHIAEDLWAGVTAAAHLSAKGRVQKKNMFFIHILWISVLPPYPLFWIFV